MKFEFNIITIWLVLSCCIVMGWLIAQATPVSYDYTLDLDQDVIHITTEYGKQHNIHPDSLEEFLIRDNI